MQRRARAQHAVRAAILRPELERPGMADDQAVLDLEAGGARGLGGSSRRGRRLDLADLRLHRWRGLSCSRPSAAHGCRDVRERRDRKRTKHGTSDDVVHVCRGSSYHARFPRVSCFARAHQSAAPPIKADFDWPPFAMLCFSWSVTTYAASAQRCRIWRFAYGQHGCDAEHAHVTNGGKRDATRC
jgi:hypothetical protein